MAQVVATKGCQLSCSLFSLACSGHCPFLWSFACLASFPDWLASLVVLAQVLDHLLQILLLYADTMQAKDFSLRTGQCPPKTSEMKVYLPIIKILMLQDNRTNDFSLLLHNFATVYNTTKPSRTPLP